MTGDVLLPGRAVDIPALQKKKSIEGNTLFKNLNLLVKFPDGNSFFP